MGRRHAGLAFMAGKHVFPGGRTDPRDGRMPRCDDLDGREIARVARHPARARAIALCALREAWEEAGIVLGRPSRNSGSNLLPDGFLTASVVPSLSPLRLIARAVTPPGAVRRFDTRFFAVWRDELAAETGEQSGELEALGWHTLDEAADLDLAEITRIVLDDLRARLAADPMLLPGGGPAFSYRVRQGRFVREPI